jgi:hypothetical protein
MEAASHSTPCLPLPLRLQIGTSLPAAVLAGEAAAADAALELSAPGMAPLRVPLQLPQDPQFM